MAGAEARRWGGGSPREGVRSPPKRGSPRGVGSEARAEQRLAAGGAAPLTRIKCAPYISVGRRLPRPGASSPCYAFVLPRGLAFEQVFVRTCVLMTVDAR